LIGEIDSTQSGRAEQLKEVLLKTGSREASFQIERLWHHDGRPIFKFAGIDSISAAELWEGAEIFVPTGQRVEPEEGAYLDDDLIGCELRADGMRIGVVEAIDNYGGGPILTVRREDGREALIPFARAICPDIDIAAKVIHAVLPEGLLDL
jgi:16S rRNA processing protein RimM